MSPGAAWVATGFAGFALAVAAGAFGAHGLQGRLDAHALELWETAARYLTYGSAAVALVGLAAARWPDAPWGRPAWSLAVGTGIFAGTVFALALGGPRWLGAVTPIGGTLMIVGLAWAGWIALQA